MSSPIAQHSRVPKTAKHVVMILTARSVVRASAVGIARPTACRERANASDRHGCPIGQ